MVWTLTPLSLATEAAFPDLNFLKDLDDLLLAVPLPVLLHFACSLGLADGKDSHSEAVTLRGASQRLR